jgi:hypothetical protein
MMGVYRAKLEKPSGEARRFRLLLYATLPDRLHAEVLSPVGTTELIVDGGSGRVAVTIPRERVSYTGSGDAVGLDKILGVHLSLEDLVRGLLGQPIDDAGYRVAREPEGQIGLPNTLEIDGSGHRFSLRLKKMQPLRVSTSGLGNGEPPPGMEVLPLESLETVELPDDPAAGEEVR